MNTRMTTVAKQVVLGQEISICGSIEDPLFRASDVTKWLGQTNSVQMLKCIPEEVRQDCIKKLKVQNGATAAWVNYLTEFGVYFVLMRSRNKDAYKYQLKIAEILKSIRLNGYAVSDNITEEQVAKLVTDAKNKAKLIAAQGNVIRIDDRFIATLKNLIDLYENEKSKIAEINAEELFENN